jgi:NifU-like protein involved in Fe-S cluster formation
LPGWGNLPDAASVAKGRAGDREQGAEVAFALRIERNCVAEARFRAFGCPHLLAAASWAAEAVLGQDRRQLEGWDWQEAARELDVPPAKFGRLLTLQDAIRAAVRNWPGATPSTV